MKPIPEIRERKDKLIAIRDRLQRKGYFARALHMNAEVKALEWVLNEG